MIKGRGKTRSGEPFVLIGLSDENWRRLRTGGDEGLGQPIRFNLRELGLPPMVVAIVGGKTEEGLLAIVEEYASRG